MARRPQPEVDVLWRGRPVQLRRGDTGWVATDPDLLVLLGVLTTKSWFGARLEATPDDVVVEVLAQVAEILAVRDPAVLSMPSADLWT